MASPEYPYAARLADQAADSAGRRWYVKEWHDAVARAVDLRAELLARALCATGGVAVPPASVDVTDDVLTVTGPVVAITPDGLAPLLIDQAGAGVTLDLATLGALLADGTHAVVIRPTPVTVSVPFTTPTVLQRDPQGNVVAETAGESVTYAPTQALGVLALIDGTTPAADEVLLLTVDVAAGAWSNAVEAWSRPVLRAFDLTVQTHDDTVTLSGAHAGALLLFSDDALVQLPPGQRVGLQVTVANDTDAAAVVITPTGGSTLVTAGDAVMVSPRGAVTVVHVGGDSWRAYGAFADGAGSGSGS